MIFLFKIIRAEKFIWIVFVLTISVAVTIAIFLIVNKPKEEFVVPENEVEYALAGRTILIDPGHGGFDAGASANGVIEKDVNLAISLKLADVVRENGGNAVLTRDSDVSTADNSRSDGTSKKASDLKRRKEMAEECDADVMISIHMNKFEQSKYWGAQVFYAENSEESKKLGEVIQSTMPKVLNDGNDRRAKKSDGSIYLLKNTVCPTVIVECGFLSNQNEAEKLTDEAYRKKVAEAICDGVIAYFDYAE